ncbi:MAG: folate-binding protein [Nitrosomonas sp.]|nr:folate-binding protein [Nitrosomonas sp.]
MKTPNKILKQSVPHNNTRSLPDSGNCSSNPGETWLGFLTEDHAQIESNRVEHFGDPAAELTRAQTAPVMVDLSHLGLIGISGTDAQSFLQGQLSCDISMLDAHTATYGGYCTPKGRLLSNFLIWQNADNHGYWLQLPVSLAQPMIKRLGMFVLRTKVTFRNETDNLIRIGIISKNVSRLLNKYFTEIPLALEPLSVSHTSEGQVICHSSCRAEIIATLAQASKIWKQLRDEIKPAGLHCWQWQEICEGIPTVQMETQEEFIPQMINLDKIGGVSFQKGCYPGQEIVARTQYLGKLKRHMYRAYIACSDIVTAGDPLFSHDMEQQASGMIINAAPSPKGGFDVLALIQISSAENHEIHWKIPTGPILTLMPLPCIAAQ